MADLDRDLSHRLSRLADAVPTARLDPGHLRAVEARHRVRVAWMTPLVALVVVVVGATLLGGGNQFGSETITATSRSGDFELTIRSAKARYSAEEPIAIEASLAFDGPDSSVRITHGGGVAGGPLGFGSVEPVLGALHLGTVFDMARHGTELERGRPLTWPFTKGAAAFGNDPLIDLYTAYLEDPVLRLAPGTWHLYATAGFEGPAGEVTLRAVIEILVTPAATSGPPEATPVTNGPVTNSVTSGPFVLSMRSAKDRYEPGEPIDIAAALTYVGTGGSIDIRHAIGSRGTPLGFGIEEPILGELRLGPGWDLACVSTTLHATIPLDQEFMKASGWSSDDPRAEDYHEFIVTPGLQLPAGTWHVFAVAEFSVGDCAEAPIKMRVDLTIEVDPEPSAAPASPEPTVEPATDGPVGIDSVGPYTLELRSEQRTYRESDVIEVTGAFTYSGDEVIDVQGFKPLIFSVAEPVYGIDLAGFTTSDCNHATLAPGQRIERPFQKSGGFSADDPNAAFMRAYLTDPVFRLPPGAWHVRVSGSLCEEECGLIQQRLFAEIEILVLPDESTPIELRTAAQSTADCPLALGGDTLALHPESGLGVSRPFSDVMPVMWPYGYTARRVAGGAVLVDPEGRVIAHEGDQLTFAGGAIETHEGGFFACTGIVVSTP